MPTRQTAGSSPGMVRCRDHRASDPDDLAELGASSLLQGYRTGAFDPVDVIDACLARIDDTDTAAGAVVTRNDGEALAQATRSVERWHRGDAGPLEGVPVGVKDIINTAGLLTAAGSPLFADHVPEADATVVARLRDAGAVIVAKTTTPEFAFGDETGDGVTNPSAPDRWAGGSSSGSAAGLASQLFCVALGTDTGGSIRVPSSYCGVSGLKPTIGRVPPRRRLRSVLDAGPCRPHGPHRGGSGAGVGRDCGPIPGRSLLIVQPGSRLRPCRDIVKGPAGRGARRMARRGLLAGSQTRPCLALCRASRIWAAPSSRSRSPTPKWPASSPGSSPWSSSRPTM